MGGSPPWVHQLLATPQPSGEAHHPGPTGPHTLHPHPGAGPHPRIAEEPERRRGEPSGRAHAEPLQNIALGQIRYDREAAAERRPGQGAPADKREDGHVYRVSQLGASSMALVLLGLWGRQAQRCVAHLRRRDLAAELRRVQVADWKATSAMVFVPRAAGADSDLTPNAQNQLRLIDAHLQRQGVAGLKVFPYAVPDRASKWNTVTVYPKLLVWFNNKRVRRSPLRALRPAFGGFFSFGAYPC